jgi:TetR/AcrR family transcriptional regulator, cholesterol catabolism regulator
METFDVLKVSIVLRAIFKSRMINAAKERILNSTREQFYRYGVKRITMDDIARQLGISKKTIYQEYKDKNALLNDLARIDMKHHADQIQLMAKTANNAVDEIVKTMKYMSATFSQINPTLFYDMQKYHIEAWKQYESFKSKCITEAVQKNMKRGIKEELYRDDIDIKILTHLRIVEMEFSMNLDYYHQHQFEFVKVHIELLKHFLFGIATLKGHKLINKMMNVNEKV